LVIKYKHQRDLRRKRIRAKISGTTDAPRLSIFRSNKYIYGQIIDDTTSHTLVSICGIAKAKQKKTDISRELGKELAKKAIAQKIKKIVFDRGGYQYKGRVKAFAEGAREGGLQF